MFISDAPRRPRKGCSREADLARFWSKVDRRGDDECWLWLGQLDRRGYGRMWLQGKKRGAHRISYWFFRGEPTDGLVIDHLCRTPSCVNPSHLEEVTQKENNKRGFGWSGPKMRQTHCKHGHEFTPENTYIHRTSRRCRICRSRLVQESKVRRLAREKAA